MKKIILTTFFILSIILEIKSQYTKGTIIEMLLKTDTTSIGQKINYPQFTNDEVTVVKVTIGPGDSTGWHVHNFPVFAYVLKGKLTLKLKNGKITEYSQNSCFAEVINTYHNGLNNGKENLELIAFFMGEKGRPLSEHEIEKVPSKQK